MKPLLMIRVMPRRGIASVLGLLLLGGCASFSSDGGFAPVQDAARQHLGADAVQPRDDAEREQLDQRVAELLVQPLTAGSAVQIALLNNRGLRAAYQQLGIAEAELVQAGRLPNPGFSFERKSAGGVLDIERQFSISVAHLIAMPLTLKLERRRFEATQRIVTQRMLELASDTRKAYYSALAAEESMGYVRQVLSAAEASADLARRMAQVGNWSRLRQAREEGFYADAALNLARAGQAQAAARERLIRLL
ncbi:MAG: TolC family protein, partial [Rubrivivax sp.]